MNEKSNSGKVCQPPSEAEIREHAYHLYEQSKRAPGRNLETWLTAEADLMAKWQEATRSIPPKWQWHYRTLLQIRERLRGERTEHAKDIRAPLHQGEGGPRPPEFPNRGGAQKIVPPKISPGDAELAE